MEESKSPTTLKSFTHSIFTFQPNAVAPSSMHPQNQNHALHQTPPPHTHDSRHTQPQILQHTFSQIQFKTH